MSILKNLVADAIEEIRGALFRNQDIAPAPDTRAAKQDGHRTFAPVIAGDADPGARADAAGDATLALRSSNEEPRPGDRGLLPGTALPGPGTHPSRPGPALDADVFIETNAAQGILGDVDWDVLTGGDAAVRILGDDGRLIERGRD
tara:strand:- start:3187 stop:3624 length:438 start_codon:yes stop_codon:yes gene_type:complete